MSEKLHLLDQAWPADQAWSGVNSLGHTRNSCSLKRINMPLRKRMLVSRLYNSIQTPMKTLFVASKGKKKQDAVNMDELVGNTDGFAESG